MHRLTWTLITSEMKKIGRYSINSMASIDLEVYVK